MEEQTKEQLLARIRELEAQVRSLSNSIIDRKDEYGLRWIDVPEAFDAESENKIPILEEVKELAIKNDDGKPTHILIEGDNYHALQCLNYTHKGKIDVIYIDPPYNTGKEFVYKDKRVLDKFPDGQTIDSNHPLRHSAWLSFMSKRLELAKNLLSERGVIFISIDDNEQANLKLLCDNVFGEPNFVNQFIWKRNSSGKTEVDKFTVNTEYVLLYKKSDQTNLNNAYKPLSVASLKLYKFNDNDGRGKYQTVSLQKPADPGPETSYDYVDNNGRTWKCPPKGWRMVYSKIKELENDNRLVLTGNTLRVKDYWEERDNEGKRIDSLWDDLPENTAGTSQLSDLFEGKVVFSNPKPTELIRRCLQIGSANSIVIDFFAGSGTTLQSVIKLNEEDAGTRQCILIQAKEPIFEIKNGYKIPKKGSTIAFEDGYEFISEITYERNRRVMQGYTNAKGEQVAGLGNSLKYYKTAFVGNNAAATATDEDKVALAHKAGNLIAIAENTLEEIVTTDSYQIFQNGNQYTAIYFTGNLEHFAEYEQKIETLRDSSRLVKVAAYIYCIGNVNVFESEFNKLTRISLNAIPQPIIEIYKQLNA